MGSLVVKYRSGVPNDIYHPSQLGAYGQTFSTLIQYYQTYAVLTKYITYTALFIHIHKCLMYEYP